jgi:hypothetical protein
MTIPDPAALALADELLDAHLSWFCNGLAKDQLDKFDPATVGFIMGHMLGTHLKVMTEQGTSLEECRRLLSAPIWTGEDADG